MPYSVGSGVYGKLESGYRTKKRENTNTKILIWTDFDLYHRNDKDCATDYCKKPAGIPDFLF
jgi:hypothetical protein